MKTPFIVIDGLEACGKGTQLKLLQTRALHEGREFVITREPGGVPLSEDLRTLIKSSAGMEASALTQSLLFWASRRNYLEKLVWPSLQMGTPVFSDRGDSSTLAYQVYAKQAPELEEEFWRMRKLIFEELSPTLYIFLDVAPEISRKRAFADSTRGQISGFDAASLEFYERVHEGFIAFGKNADINMVTIDGMRDSSVIHEELYSIVKGACGW